MTQTSLEISSICTACDNCHLICPEHAVITNGKDYFIDNWSCTQCGLCIEICPMDCIKEIKTT